MADDFQVTGDVSGADFSLKIHRGEGMALLAMNWKAATPPDDFVGFAIEYKPPGGSAFKPVRNRICFPGKEIAVPPGAPAAQYPSTEAPIQKFRWVHFPREAGRDGRFTYRVTPMFMDANDVLHPGVAQEAKLTLARETYPGKVNIAFTRGFVSSQAFLDLFGGEDGFRKLVPPSADEGLEFDPQPPHPKADEAYAWMGFEARERIVDLLDTAIAEGASVSVVAYELNLPELVERFERLGPKLRIIIDDSSTTKTVNGVKTTVSKGDAHSAESKAAKRIKAAGGQVLRQHMTTLQHNKMIIVDGPVTQRVVCGSTNFSWRGFYVQANNAVLLDGELIVRQQLQAFEAYWADNVSQFKASIGAQWRPIPIPGVDGQISMSPHSASHAAKEAIAADIGTAQSSVFYSLAFLYQTPGVILDALAAATNDPAVFVYGISDKKTGIVVHQTDGNPVPVSAAALTKGVPEPFKSEAKGGSGVKMHHKFVVVDFDTPDARVYTGSFNFSRAADLDNGENLLCFRDRRIATVYMVEALRIFDSYQFRVSSAKAKASGGRKSLRLPPRAPGEVPWWKSSYTVPIRIRDRKLFA